MKGKIVSKRTYHPFRSAKAKANYLALYDELAKTWPVPSEVRFVDTSYGQTFVRISGPVVASPLVLLPGAGHCSLMWRTNVESLATRFRVFAVDTIINTGCVGRSVFTRIFKGADDATSWLDQLFRGLQLGNSINLAGLSYGGWLTSQYALRFSERLRKIVLLAPAATVLPIQLEFYLRAFPSGLFHLRSVHRRFLAWVFSDLMHKNRDLLEEIVEHGLVAIQSFKSPDYGWRVPPTVLTDEEWKMIKVPALLIVGENEVLYSAQEVVRRLSELRLGIEVRTIPGAGHDMTFVQPEIVNREMLNFLD